jgi:hypothetical protein
MVDFNTYRELHPDQQSFILEYPSVDNPDVTRMEMRTMETLEPPRQPEIYIFPD